MQSNLERSPEELSGALESVVRALPRDVLLNLIVLLMEQEHLSARSRDALTFAMFLRRSTSGSGEPDREALLGFLRQLPPEEQREVSVALLEAVALPEH
jgi:hypothetical protein